MEARTAAWTEGICKPVPGLPVSVKCAKEERSCHMFDQINLTIYSPDKSKSVSAEVNAVLTVEQVLEELRRNRFFPDEVSPRCRQLLVESSGFILPLNSTLNGLEDGEVLRAVVFAEDQLVYGNRIAVTFLHPTNGTSIEVEVPDSMTAEEAVQELIACGFMPDRVNPEQIYALFVKNSQTQIAGSQTLGSGGAANGSVLTVISRMPSMPA